jgi:hypothetical protein
VDVAAILPKLREGVEKLELSLLRLDETLLVLSDLG